MGLALANKLYHDCLISDHYHNNKLQMATQRNQCFLFENVSVMLHIQHASEGAVHYWEVEKSGARLVVIILE